MTKEITDYTEVKQRNGVTRRVPKQYYKPNGKTKTVSMTLPIAIVEIINNISENTDETKSAVMSQLLFEALEARDENVSNIKLKEPNF